MIRPAWEAEVGNAEERPTEEYQVIAEAMGPVAWPLTMSGQVHRPVFREGAVARFGLLPGVPNGNTRFPPLSEGHR